MKIAYPKDMTTISKIGILAALFLLGCGDNGHTSFTFPDADTGEVVRTSEFPYVMKKDYFEWISGTYIIENNPPTVMGEIDHLDVVYHSIAHTFEMRFKGYNPTQTFVLDIADTAYLLTYGWEYKGGNLESIEVGSCTYDGELYIRLDYVHLQATYSPDSSLPYYLVVGQKYTPRPECQTQRKIEYQVHYLVMEEG